MKSNFSRKETWIWFIMSSFVVSTRKAWLVLIYNLISLVKAEELHEVTDAVKLCTRICCLFCRLFAPYLGYVSLASSHFESEIYSLLRYVCSTFCSLVKRPLLKALPWVCQRGWRFASWRSLCQKWDSSCETLHWHESRGRRPYFWASFSAYQWECLSHRSSAAPSSWSSPASY